MWGQNNWKHKAAVNVGYMFNCDEGYYHNSMLYGAEFGYVYKDKLLLGVGLGYSKVTADAVPYDFVYEYLPVYADFRYYVPLGGKVSFLAGADIGYSISIRQKFIPRTPDEFLIYPQIGVGFKLYKNLSLEVSGGYRRELINQWGFNIGIAF